MKYPRRILIAILAVLLNACAAVPAGQIATAVIIVSPSALPASETPVPTALLEPNATVTGVPPPPVTRVVIISVDGLQPDAIDMAPMPALQNLMGTGAYSLQAQTIDPSKTLPATTSMLTGLCPSAHGVTWNKYLPERGSALGTDLFDLAHEAGMRTVMVVGKEKLRQITGPESLDVFQWVNDPDRVVAQKAAARIRQGFSVLFVELPDGDAEGHVYGWMSLQQLLALRGTDGGLQILLDALTAAGMRENTLIIVTADHGGHETSHGFNIPADMTIPWIIDGPGVVLGKLTRPINITDTAATAAWALGLALPPEWSGRPVYEAFGIPETEPRAEPRCH